MNAFASITLAPHGLELRCTAAALSEDRPLNADDTRCLEGWAKRYLEVAGKDDHHATFLALGQEMHDWLNGSGSFLTRALEAASAPLLIEFAVSRQDDGEMAKALLNAPWELLASGGEHWALKAGLVFCPIRRMGKTAVPSQPSAKRLGLVFMAAAPRGADNLDYESEEVSILTATRNLGLDLSVEESGTLELLSACVAREKPDVIQISCHGTLLPRPGLLLEDDIGDLEFVEANKLVTKLAAQHPRLLFLSACETAKSDPVLPSLARSLVLAGGPAVLGWAAPVRDNEATLFAALLYERLTAGGDLAHALAYARLELSQHDQLAPNGSRDWHLARLFLNPTGGGALATAGGPQRHLGQGQAAKTFLDAKGKQVPVAGELEFVGRRREIQGVLREFRSPAGGRHAGVFIHGVGRQGKSSLAARVARRLEHTHETVVIFGRYDAPFILRTIGERLATPAVTDIVARHLPLVEADKSKLLPALTELLEGPCAQAVKDAAGRELARPILLVIDDFEQALDGQNHRTLKPEYFDSIRALLLAFRSATTESHLLFTCRFQFTCPHDAHDLADADHLLDVPLHGMNEREAQKQAGAKLRVPEIARTIAKLPPQKIELLKKLIIRSILNARGNPGLQDLLFTLAVQDPAACDRCLSQMEEFLRSGTLPAEDRVRAFLENLALQSLTGLLTPAQRELLRAATIFELPVPLEVMRKLGTTGVEGDIARLLALGLWEIYEDLHDAPTPALALNELVRPLAGVLNDSEQSKMSCEVVGTLFERWGGETGGKERGSLQNHQLTRLGLLARDARLLASTGADALRFLDKQFEYQRAAVWAKAVLAIVDAAGVSASVDLLRTAAERCQQVGDVADASSFRERAMKLIELGGETDIKHHAATLLTHARALVQQGQPDEALRHLEQAKHLLPPGREQAIVIGEIANIRAAKGEVDAALQLHQEGVTVHEALGDKRERAVTLGDIARIRAAKGEVDAALQLHLERLAVYEALGDKRERAVTLGDIARIWADKGEVDVALQLHQERLGIFEALGETRLRAVTLGDIARIWADKGEVDAALQLHQGRLGIFEALGDKRERAGTLMDIARLRTNKGEMDAALQLHQEALAIYEALGEKRSRAVTLGDIARIKADKGEVDAALKLQNERLTAYRELCEMSGIASASFDLAQIEIQQQKWQEAYEHLAESYTIYTKLGRLDGICVVGLDLGQFLWMAGQREEGLAILTRSRDGFVKLGQAQLAQRAQAIIDQISKLPPQP